MTEQSKGLSLVLKLKLEHINLTSFSRMRVDLAAQVILSCACAWWDLFGVNLSSFMEPSMLVVYLLLEGSDNINLAAVL